MNCAETVQTEGGVGAHRRKLHVMTTTSLFRRSCDGCAPDIPQGVPGPDRVPLLALLRATPLTEDQLKEVVRQPDRRGRRGARPTASITRDEIAEFINDVTQHDAGPENIARVAAKLAAAGWPSAGINGSDA